MSHNLVEDIYNGYVLNHVPSKKRCFEALNPSTSECGFIYR